MRLPSHHALLAFQIEYQARRVCVCVCGVCVCVCADLCALLTDCDDAQTNLTVDWDPEDETPYTCAGDPGWETPRHRAELWSALAERTRNGECWRPHWKRWGRVRF